MTNQIRVYCHPASELRTQFFLGILGIAMLAGVAWVENKYIPLVVVGAVGIIFANWRSNKLKTVISDDGISTQGVFGEKSLRWNEINRISGRGYGLRLHNLDGDVALSPSIELPGYEEVIETIGAQRPDLFSPSRHPIFKKTAEYAILLPLVALVSIGVGVIVWLQAGNIGVIPFLVFFITGLAVLGYSFSAPQSVRIEGEALWVKRLWGEKTFSVAEIRSVELAYQRDRSGRNYFVRLNLHRGKPLKLIGLAPAMLVVYLVLKKWHGENSKLV